MDFHLFFSSLILFLLFLLILISALDCGPPPVLVNGNVATQNGTLFGSKATYICNFKYAFIVDSSMKRTCKSSGKWSNERIECGAFVKRSAYFLNNDHFYPCCFLTNKINFAYNKYSVFDMKEISALSSYKYKLRKIYFISLFFSLTCSSYIILYLCITYITSSGLWVTTCAGKWKCNYSERDCSWSKCRLCLQLQLCICYGQFYRTYLQLIWKLV